jgi:hypothetical protein
MVMFFLVIFQIKFQEKEYVAGIFGGIKTKLNGLKF